MLYRALFFMFAALFLVSPALQSARAQVALTQDNPSVVSLLPGWMRADGLYVAAIDIRLADGWKTYWREPGKNGIPPQFDWGGSDNIAQVGYFWPSPRVYGSAELRTIGYADRLILPVLLRPEDPDTPINARISADYGVCDDVCIPRYDDLAALLPIREVHNTEVITPWIDRRPLVGQSAGLSSAECNLAPYGDDFILSADLSFEAAPERPHAVVIEAGRPDIWISEPDQTLGGNSIRLEADLQNYSDAPLMLDRSALLITLIGAGQAIEIRGCE